MESSVSLPFSPLLLLRPLLRPFPKWMVCRILEHMVQRLHRLYPCIAPRLEPIAGTDFLIVPLEFPFAILASVGANGRINVQPLTEKIEADVYITGTLASLTNMLEGNCDGDALFFSRELKVEGNTEALLTLRNAIDSEAVQLAEVMMPHHIQPFTQKIHSPFQRFFSALEDDMHLMAKAIRGDLELRWQASNEKQRKLKHQLEENGQILKQLETRLQRLNKRVDHGKA